MVTRGSDQPAAQLFEPTALGPLTLRNRVLKAATFEGMSPDNVVSPALIEFHRRVAAGGVAQTTVSYLAVSQDGMGAPAEIYIHDAALPGLAEIASVVHAEGAHIAAQLGHAGAVGELPGKKLWGPSARRTMMGGTVRPVSVDQIDTIVADFAKGGRMLRDAGFDTVELHFGHHYLPSSFLSPKWNRRTDDYGGSLENRARLLLRILDAVRTEVGQGMAVTAKLNIRDAVRGGLEVDESIEVAKLLAATGKLDALQLTGGGSQQNQMYMFRGDVPRAEFLKIIPQWWQRLGFKLFGRWILRGYPYEEAYFLDHARRFRAALDLPLIYLGGVSTIETAERVLGEGFQFVALGRALVREPDLVKRWEEGTARAATCIHCNKCMLSIYTGTRCVIDNPQPLDVRGSVAS